MSEIQENQMHVEVLWGNPILDEGFTPIPNLIVKNYTRVGLSHAEWGLLTIMFSFKHGGGDIFPSQETLAKMFYAEKYTEGKSERALRKLIKSMEDKDLLEVGYRYINGVRSSNTYNFGLLVQACLKYATKEDKAVVKRVTVAKKKKKPLAEQKVPVVQEQKVPVVEEPEVPVVQEPEVPTKKTREKDNLKKTKEKESIYQEKIQELDLPVSVKRELVKKIDRLILFKINVEDVSLVFNAKEIDAAKFVHVLDNVLSSKKIGKFKNMLEKSVDNYLVNVNKKIQDGVPKQVKVADYLKEQQEQSKNEVSAAAVDPTTEEEYEENAKWLENLLNNEQ